MRSPGTLNRSGRPRKITPRGDRIIKSIVSYYPTVSCRKIRSALLSVGVAESEDCVSWWWVHEFDLKSHKPARKPRLTTEMKKKRLEFAFKYENWTEEQWWNITFSDESTFQLSRFHNPSPRRQYVWSPQGNSYDEKYTMLTIKHPPSQMICGYNIKVWNC